MPDRPKGAAGSNPLKDRSNRTMNKGTRQRTADHADPEKERTPVSKTKTGQGGAKEKGTGSPDVDHPSQKGGVKHEQEERRRGG